MEYLEIFLKYMVAGAGLCVGAFVIFLIAALFARKNKLSKKQSFEGLQAFKEGLSQGRASEDNHEPKTIFQGRKPNVKSH